MVSSKKINVIVFAAIGFRVLETIKGADVQLNICMLAFLWSREKFTLRPNTIFRKSLGIIL